MPKLIGVVFNQFLKNPDLLHFGVFFYGFWVIKMSTAGYFLAST